MIIFGFKSWGEYRQLLGIQPAVFHDLLLFDRILKGWSEPWERRLWAKFWRKQERLQRGHCLVTVTT